jgi:Cu/Ag efflux protein CusF
MKKAIELSLWAAAALAAPALAQQSDHGAHHGAPRVAQPGALAEGEVRKVDKDAKKITLKHGPITNLDMPAMTMVFRVKDPSMLELVKAGDQVRFAAENVNGQLTITRIDKAR